MSATNTTEHTPKKRGGPRGPRTPKKTMWNFSISGTFETPEDGLDAYEEAQKFITENLDNFTGKTASGIEVIGFQGASHKLQTDNGEVEISLKAVKVKDETKAGEAKAESKNEEK